MKESRATTGEKEEECKQELAEKVVFFCFFFSLSPPVVAVKQKALGADVDGSLLWCGVEACWRPVCFCDPAHSSFDTSDRLEEGRMEQGVSAHQVG